MPTTSQTSNFNPRAYVRHDDRVAVWLSVRVDFNPRAYVRHDDCVAEAPGRDPDFNPRAYVRHDYIFGQGAIGYGISIHVPT